MIRVKRIEKKNLLRHRLHQDRKHQRNRVRKQPFQRDNTNYICPFFLEWNLPSDMAPAASSLRSGMQDCRSAHRQAIDESQSVNNAFIPECDEFGNYSPVQCYKVQLFFFHLCILYISTLTMNALMTLALRDQKDIFGPKGNYVTWKE